MLNQSFLLFMLSILVLAPIASGQSFAHCWERSGKKIDGADAKSLIGIIAKSGIPDFHRPNGDEWNTDVVNCQNVWVMPNYSRMYYACKIQLQGKTYSVDEASSMQLVKILEANQFPYETGGEITRWQVNQLSCGTSEWAGPNTSNFVENDFAFYPVFGGKMVKFDTNYPVKLGPKGYVREGVLSEATELTQCNGRETEFNSHSKMSFAVNGTVTWWAPEPTWRGYCICGTAEEPCPGWGQ